MLHGIKSLLPPTIITFGGRCIDPFNCRSNRGTTLRINLVVQATKKFLSHMHSVGLRNSERFDCTFLFCFLLLEIKASWRFEMSLSGTLSKFGDEVGLRAGSWSPAKGISSETSETKVNSLVYLRRVESTSKKLLMLAFPPRHNT